MLKFVCLVICQSPAFLVCDGTNPVMAGRRGREGQSLRGHCAHSEAVTAGSDTTLGRRVGDRTGSQQRGARLQPLERRLCLVRRIRPQEGVRLATL